MNFSEKFNKLENILLDERDNFYVQTGVPYILFIYNPEKEIECRRKIKELANYLQHKYINIQEIPLNTFIFKLLKQHNALEDVYEKERSDFNEFIRGISQIYEQRIKDFIIEQVKEECEVLFITRIGSIFPFFKVSDIIDKILNYVKKITVFFYPGTYIKDNLTNDEEVLFFGKYKSDSTYRTYPIG